MAANDVIEVLHVQDFFQELGTINLLRIVNSPQTATSQSGPVRGLLLSKLGAGYNGVVAQSFLSANVVGPLVNGLTARTSIADDPWNASPGSNVRLGVSFKLLQTGAGPSTVDFTTTGYGPETLFTITLNAVTGRPTITSNAVAKGASSVAINAIVVNSDFLIRIRRLGDDPLDTHPGDILLTGVTLLDT